MTHSTTAFELLHPRVQKWVWNSGWKKLRDIQERAARPLLETEDDLLLSSATASGKTEAVFLPLATLLARNDRRQPGVDILYLSPLKALINDQEGRISSIMEMLDVGVHRWHGDVSYSKKKRLLEDPAGVLLITPESLEALFVRRGSQVKRLFHGLIAVVVDELHAYIGTERGRQLQSLLHRIDLSLERVVRRVAMSATLGDMGLAAEFLRPRGGDRVIVITSEAYGQEVKLQVRGYENRPPRLSKREQEEAGSRGNDIPVEDITDGDVLAIAQHLYRELRGGRHLVFANRRGEVERYSDLLRRACERDLVPNEFLPHHGSLNREIREEAEARLRESTAPATVIATTTLELGIDIGTVESIAQIGPPPSVMSMRQRLGRSGRRGEPAVLRIYVQEPSIDERTPPHYQLRSHVVQSVAMVRLLVDRWFEPPISGSLHLSTLVQQVLSTIAEHGGILAKPAWVDLCAKGPFEGVDERMFVDFLRSLARHDLIVQTHEGEIVLGLVGERLVNHYEFYAAFATVEEYRIVSGGRTLGSLPVEFPLVVGNFMIFAGRRWRIDAVDEEKKVVHVLVAAGGRPPRFGGNAVMVHDRIRAEMRWVYEDAEEPPYLDREANALLSEGREAFRRFELGSRSWLVWGKHVLLFPWVGDRALHTLAIWLRRQGLDASVEREVVLIENTSPPEVFSVLQVLQKEGAADPLALAHGVANKHKEKHHWVLEDALLTADYASSSLDVHGAARAVTNLQVGGSRGSMA